MSTFASRFKGTLLERLLNEKGNASLAQLARARDL